MSRFIIILSISIFSAGSIQAGVIGRDYDEHINSDHEAHDFSEGLAQSESSHYGSLGSLGDHLDESHFPQDYAESYKGGEYEEAAASEHIEYGGYEEPQHHDFDHETYGSFDHDIHSELHDFDTKPVPGINHGKGALSYSTTYEFKDPKP